MLLRRALVTAPLAVLVAVVAHALTFSDGHALAGGHGGPLLAVAVGGSLLCALVAFLSMAISQPDARQGRRLLREALPGGGRPGVTTAVLLGGGLVAFAAIEAAEGHATARLHGRVRFARRRGGRGCTRGPAQCRLDRRGRRARRRGSRRAARAALAVGTRSALRCSRPRSQPCPRHAPRARTSSPRVSSTSPEPLRRLCARTVRSHRADLPHCDGDRRFPQHFHSLFRPVHTLCTGRRHRDRSRNGDC